MMKTNKTLLLFLILLSQLLFSQQVPRELLSGKIMNDSIGLENIKVLNININKFAISDQQGYFNRRTDQRKDGREASRKNHAKAGNQLHRSAVSTRFQSMDAV